MSYITTVVPFNATLTATSNMGVLAGPINVEHFDKFCLQFQNDNTGIAFLDLVVQAAVNSAGTAADLAPSWYNVPTATIPVPSALGVTATVITSAIENCYRYLRVLGATSATTSFGKSKVTVGGFRRLH